MIFPSYVITGFAIVGALALGWLIAYLNPGTRDQAKWWILAALALGGGLLALLYGKETASVLDLKVKEHNARGKLLNKQREAALAKARSADDAEEKQAHIERADTLQLDAERVKQARLRLLEDTGDLTDDDVELVRRDLARKNSGPG